MLFPRGHYEFGKRNYSLSKGRVQVGQALSGTLYVMLREGFISTRNVGKATLIS